MGAWGWGAFDNDDSGDWLEELQESADATLIADALDVVVTAEEGELEVTEASQGVAAAEIVAALRGQPPEELDEMAQEWVAANARLDVRDLVSVAREALQRIRTDSELKELWDESKDRSQWYASLDDISRRLGAKVVR